MKSQTYENWEIIIVDDISNDQEFAKIKEFENGQNIKVLQRSGGIKGPSSCRNLGVKISEGDYLLFLDSDDLLMPFCLEQRIQCMKEDNMLQLGIFKMEEFNLMPGDRKIIFNKIVPKNEWTGLFLKNENPWQTMAPIWRKDFFEKVGGFDEELLFMEDPELHLRAIHYPKAEIKTFYDHAPDCYYRINHIDDSKKDFYYNSIFYRIVFYKKILQKNNGDFITKNRRNIRIGIYILIKTFFYSRKNQFPELYHDLKGLMKESNLFSSFEIRKLLFLIDIGNTESPLLKKLKVKGLCFKLLPGK